MRLTEFERITTLLAKQHKIKIKEGKGWAANIKEKEVFYRKKDIHDLPEEHILGLTLHEIAHIHYTTESPLPKENEELIHTTMNVLEDIAVESIIAKDYKNAGEILESTQQEVLDSLVDILPTLEISKHEKTLLYAAIRYENRGYEYNVTDYEILGNKISKVMKKRKKEIYRKKTEDLLPLAKTIVNMLLKDLGQPTPEEKRKMGEKARETNNATADQEISDETKKQIIKKLGGKTYGKDEIITHPNIHFINEIADQAAVVGKRLRSVLKRNNSMEFGGRYRTGKLLTKRLIRTRILKDRRPFSRRIVKSNQSYAFAVACDVSGSMFGSRRTSMSAADCALSSMFMMGEALKKANTPRSMSVFGDKAEKITPVTRESIKWEEMIRKDRMNKAGGGTDIDQGIYACIEELQKVRAERKIMIIITDGDSSEDEIEKAYKEAIKSEIEPLSITIGRLDRDYESPLQKIFKEGNINVDERNPKEIGNAFIKILKETIK